MRQLLHLCRQQCVGALQFFVAKQEALDAVAGAIRACHRVKVEVVSADLAVSDEVDRVADRVAVLRTRLVALDTPSALRARLFGSRVRIALTARADEFAALLTSEGMADVRVEGRTLSVPHGAPQGGSHDGHRAFTPALVRRLVEAGADIESVEHDEPSLEAVYLQLLQQDRAGQARP